jgi:hypothetical protein
MNRVGVLYFFIVVVVYYNKIKKNISNYLTDRECTAITISL